MECPEYISMPKPNYLYTTMYVYICFEKIPTHSSSIYNHSYLIKAINTYTPTHTIF